MIGSFVWCWSLELSGGVADVIGIVSIFNSAWENDIANPNRLIWPEAPFTNVV